VTLCAGGLMSLVTQFQIKPNSGVLGQIESGLTRQNPTSGTQVDISLPFCRSGWGLKVEGPDSCVLFIFYESIL
jgi:hypothetical protein